MLTHLCRRGPEYRNKVLTRLAFNNPRWGCYALAVTIFSLGILRDHLYQRALAEQPKLPLLHYTEFKLLAIVLFAIGGTLVVTSMWALGVTGTYLGDYFVSASLPLPLLRFMSGRAGCTLLQGADRYSTSQGILMDVSCIPNILRNSHETRCHPHG